MRPWLDLLVLAVFVWSHGFNETLLKWAHDSKKPRRPVSITLNAFALRVSELVASGYVHFTHALMRSDLQLLAHASLRCILHLGDPNHLAQVLSFEV